MEEGHPAACSVTKPICHAPVHPIPVEPIVCFEEVKQYQTARFRHICEVVNLLQVCQNVVTYPAVRMEITLSCKHDCGKRCNPPVCQRCDEMLGVSM